MAAHVSSGPCDLALQAQWTRWEAELEALSEALSRSLPRDKLQDQQLPEVPLPRPLPTAWPTGKVGLVPPRPALPEEELLAAQARTAALLHDQRAVVVHGFRPSPHGCEGMKEKQPEVFGADPPKEVARLANDSQPSTDLKPAAPLASEFLQAGSAATPPAPDSEQAAARTGTPYNALLAELRSCPPAPSASFKSLTAPSPSASVCAPPKAEPATGIPAAPAPAPAHAPSPSPAPSPAPAPAPPPAPPPPPPPPPNPLKRAMLKCVASSRTFGGSSEALERSPLAWRYDRDGVCIAASHADRLEPVYVEGAVGVWSAKIVHIEVRAPSSLQSSAVSSSKDAAATSADTSAKTSSKSVGGAQSDDEFADDDDDFESDDEYDPDAEAAADRARADAQAAAAAKGCAVVDSRLPNLVVHVDSGAVLGTPDVRALLLPGAEADALLELSLTQQDDYHGRLVHTLRVRLTLRRDALVDPAHVLFGKQLHKATRPLIVFDVSGSMAGEGRLRLFKDAVLHFLKNLIAQRMSPYLYKLTHLNLIAFSTNCEAAHKSLQPVSPAVVAGLTGWLARIKPDGQTHSWLPFEMARDGAGTSDDGTTVDRILFITDGAPSEMHPYQRSLDAAKAASAALGDCPIACVAYGSPVDVDGFLKELANETKGTFDRVDIEGLREAVTAVRKAKEADEKRLAQAKLEEEEKLTDK